MIYSKTMCLAMQTQRNEAYYTQNKCIWNREIGKASSIVNNNRKDSLFFLGWNHNEKMKENSFNWKSSYFKHHFWIRWENKTQNYFLKKIVRRISDCFSCLYAIQFEKNKVFCVNIAFKWDSIETSCRSLMHPHLNNTQ